MVAFETDLATAQRVPGRQGEMRGQGNRIAAKITGTQKPVHLHCHHRRRACVDPQCLLCRFLMRLLGVPERCQGGNFFACLIGLRFVLQAQDELVGHCLPDRKGMAVAILRPPAAAQHQTELIVNVEPACLP